MLFWEPSKVSVSFLFFFWDDGPIKMLNCIKMEKLTFRGTRLIF